MTKSKQTTEADTALLEHYDSWLSESGPAALVLRQELEPVEGRDGVFFPSTFAPAEDRSKFAGGYNIDTFDDGSNVCQIDSVGSQANRIEPLFLRADYANLVPQIVIVAGSKRINLLEAGHRAGDAIVRCSELKAELHQAFKAALDGNAEPLAKIAPTSLVFGVWDSRDTEAKMPRLIASTIRAFNVKRLSRSANYLVQQQVDYTKEKLIPIWESDKEKELYSKRGFLNALASSSHGGVMLSDSGKILRDVTVSLAALRRLAVAGEGATDRTIKLRRYILSLALVSMTANLETYLRQGCNLVPAKEAESIQIQVVGANGKRESQSIDHAEVKTYAQAVALEFGVGASREVAFSRVEAENDIKGRQKISGIVSAVDEAAKTFSIKGSNEEISIVTDDKTQFKKGRTKSRFEEVVLLEKTLDVEVKDGVAVIVVLKS